MLHWGGLIPVIRAPVPWLWTMLFTYTTIIPTSPVVYPQRKFWQGPSPPIMTYRMLIHWDDLHMSWNKYFRMLKNGLSGCQGLVEINIWEPPLYMSEQWDWSGTYKLETSALSFIWFWVTILRLCIQERIKNLQFGQNWSPFIISRVHIMMKTMYLNFLVSGWSQQLCKPEGIRETGVTPRSHSKRKSDIMIQESNTLDIDETTLHLQFP